MGTNSGIEWTTHTFNPWWGCTKVSPACDNCYAEQWDRRCGGGHWGKDVPRRFFGEDHWREPLRWNRAAEKAGEVRRVFCGSMCDVMEDGGAQRLLAPVRARLYDLIELTPKLAWLLLTKRPQNFERMLPPDWIERPRANVWLMTTVESPDYLWRVDALRDAPAVMRGLSIEPLLAPMPTLHERLDGIGWVIVGGESGQKARSMHPEWVRSIRDQCAAAVVPFFFKQWGEWAPYNACAGNSERAQFADGREIVRVGKRAAGRLLDGREHNGMPEATR